jgi:hypothetical protein
MPGLIHHPNQQFVRGLTFRDQMSHLTLVYQLSYIVNIIALDRNSPERQCACLKREDRDWSERADVTSHTSSFFNANQQANERSFIQQEW